jgi:hypothetical protein
MPYSALVLHVPYSALVLHVPYSALVLHVPYSALVLHVPYSALVLHVPYSALVLHAPYSALVLHVHASMLCMYVKHIVVVSYLRPCSALAAYLLRLWTSARLPAFCRQWVAVHKAHGSGGSSKVKTAWAAGTGYGGHTGGLTAKDKQAMSVGCCSAAA